MSHKNSQENNKTMYGEKSVYEEIYKWEMCLHVTVHQIRTCANYEVSYLRCPVPYK